MHRIEYIQETLSSSLHSSFFLKPVPNKNYRIHGSMYTNSLLLKIYFVSSSGQFSVPRSRAVRLAHSGRSFSGTVPPSKTPFPSTAFFKLSTASHQHSLRIDFDVHASMRLLRPGMLPIVLPPRLYTIAPPKCHRSNRASSFLRENLKNGSAYHGTFSRNVFSS